MNKSKIPAILLVTVAAAILFRTGLSQQAIPVGYATIRANTGPLPSGTALFQLRYLDPAVGAQVLVSEAGVGAVEPIRGGRIFVDQAATATGLALANASDTDAGLTFTLRDESGRSMGSRALSLPAGRHLARYVNDGELFPGLASSFKGSLTFSASEPVAAVTLRQAINSRGEALLAALPVANLGGAETAALAGPLILPHLGAGGGLTTQIVLINPSDQAASGRVRFFDDNGQPLPLDRDGVSASELLYQLSPNGVFDATLRRAEGVVQGYALVIPETGATPAGTAVFQFRTGTGQLITEAGVAAVAASDSVLAFIDNAGTGTGIALANPGNGANEVRFDLITRTGAPIQSASRTLAAGGHLALFADQLFPGLPPGFTGLLRASSSSPVSAVTLKFTINRRNEPVLTTLPISDENAPPAGNLLVFPQVGFGPGFITRLILINSAEIPSMASLEFRRSDSSLFDVDVRDTHSADYVLNLAASTAQQIRPEDPGVPSRLVIDPFSPSETEFVVHTGGEMGLSPIIIDSNGEARDDFPATFGSLDETVAGVDSRGVVSGLQAGYSTLTVTSAGIVAVGTIAVVDSQRGSSGFAISGVVQDFAGRSFLADSIDHAILVASTPSTPPEVYAGKVGTEGLQNGPKFDALFSNPSFLAFNQADGNLYVSDGANNVIRRVGPGTGGEVVTVAGSPGGSPGYRDGLLNQALFRNPQGVAFDTRGRLWVADRDNHVIRRIDFIAGMVSTVAGFGGDSGLRDGTGLAARFSSPAGIALEPEPLDRQLSRLAAGGPPPPISVIVADTGNNVLRRVREDGLTTTVGPGSLSPTSLSSGAWPVNKGAAALVYSAPSGVAVDGFGRIYVSEPSLNRVTALLSNGQRVPVAQPGSLRAPRGLSIARTGQLAVGVEDDSVVRLSFGQPLIESMESVLRNGQRRIQINGRNFSTDSTVNLPEATVQDVVVEDSRTISFVASSANGFADGTLTIHNRAGVRQSLIRVFSDGTFGDVTVGFGDLPAPSGVAVDFGGNVYISNAAQSATAPGAIYRVEAGTETLTRFAGRLGGDTGDGGPARDATFGRVQDVAPDSVGNVVLVDGGTNQVRAVAASGLVTTFVSQGLNRPMGITVGPDGSIFFSDSMNHRIRALVPPVGALEAVAGAGQAGFSGDGGSALAAQFDFPTKLAADRNGNLFIDDFNNRRIRRVDSNGMISTVAGTGGNSSTGDGGPAVNASIGFPGGIAVDVDGRLYIGANSRVRQVGLDGIIRTIAGNGGNPENRNDGDLAVNFPLREVIDVAVDAGGNVYILEQFAAQDQLSLVIVEPVTGTARAIRLGTLLAS